jgi:predicted transcriptional regulator
MKVERVYREILYGLLEEKCTKFTQKELSKKCQISISTVNYALKPLVRMHAIEMCRKGFTVVNLKKLLCTGRV